MKKQNRVVMPAVFGGSHLSEGTHDLSKLRSRKHPDKTSRKMRKLLGHSGGLEQIKKEHKGKWTEHKGENEPLPVRIAERKVVSEEEKALMIQKKFSGSTNKEIADMFAVSDSYIDTVLEREFLPTPSGRQKLLSLLLHNSVAVGAHFATRIDELSGMQAAIATGIMTGKFIDLQKAIKENADETPPDFGALSRLNSTMDEIKGYLGTESGPIIDAELAEDG